ncbi:MAG: T9SS type A sorting domain-containing protein, partial [Ignavibacteriaceae bacterium]
GFMYISLLTDANDIYSDGKGLFKFDITGTLPVSESDAIFNIDGATTYNLSDLVFDYGTDRNSSSDDILYYATRAGNGNPDDGVWRIDNISSVFVLPVPVILEDSLYTNGTDANFYTGAIPLDAAGNIVLFENWNEHLFFVSPPSDSPTNSFTTTSPKNFSVGNAVSVEDEKIPNNYFLAQNFPNPFNPSTNIKFGLSKGSNVYLAIYNILGEEVAVLINDQFKAAGTYNVQFNAVSLPSGTYIYRLETNNNVESKKMILMK